VNHFLNTSATNGQSKKKHLDFEMSGAETALTEVVQESKVTQYTPMQQHPLLSEEFEKQKKVMFKEIHHKLS